MDMGCADMDIGWITPSETGEKWDIKERRVEAMCFERANSGSIWLIPKNTPKPIDGRTKVAK
jgi:hypothetical protein